MKPSVLHPIFLALGLLALLLQACSSGSGSVGKEEQMLLQGTLEKWVDIYNEDKFKDYGKFQADPLKLFGRWVDRSEARGGWWRAKGDYTSYTFLFGIENAELDSVTDKWVRFSMPLRAHKWDHEDLIQEREIRVYISREEPREVVEVSGDMRGLCLAVEAQTNAAAKATGLFNDEGEPNFELLQNLKEQYSGDFTDIAFATRVDGKDLVYVLDVKNEWKGWEYDKWAPTGKVGLADLDGKLICPIKYDQIYTFGMLAPGLAEVRLDGKFGLIDAEGKEFLLPEYDLILPPFDKKSLVGVKVDGAYGTIGKNGRLTLTDPPADVKSLLLPFNIEHRLNSGGDTYEGPEMVPVSLEHGPAYASCIFPPAFMQELGFSPAIQPVKTFDPGTYQAFFIEEEFELGEKIMGFISALETWTFEPRYEYHDKTYTLSTFDSSLSAVAQVRLMSLGGDITTGHYCDNEQAIWFGSDTLMLRFSEINKTEGKYREDMAYRFFLLGPDGKVEELKSGRKYPFTEFARIDKTFIEGCFVEEVPEGEWNKERREKSEQFYGEFWISDSYSAAEIKEMIREIEAALKKGKGKYDAANLAFLKDYLKKFEANPSEYYSRTLEFESW